MKELWGHLFILCTFVKTCFSASSGFGPILSHAYLRCPPGEVYSGQQTGTVTGRSALDCVAKCSQLTDCLSVNVCRTGVRTRAVCTLMADTNIQGCVGLSTAQSPGCFFLQRRDVQWMTSVPTTEQTTTEIVCQNGGTPNGDHCACPIQYGGITCNRLIRDCTEAYDNGYQSRDYDGAYLVQPITSPAAFRVRCVFEWGGVTLPLYRTTLNFNVNWATAKAGFGDDLATNPASEDYFIGLDNLHHLLRQAAYQNHIFVMFDDWAGMGSSFYDNFTMGDEASSYEISYAQFVTVENPADDGLAAPAPISFTTLDHDVSGCGVARGGAGWYGADCSGYGVFSNDFTWPVSGADKSLNSLMFNLVRQSGYYVV